MKTKIVLAFTCLFAALVPRVQAKDISILIYASEKSPCQTYSSAISAEVKNIFSQHDDYSNGTVEVTWSAMNPGSYAFMEGYHHPGYQAGNIALLNNHYDFVILIDDDDNAAKYEEYHFEGIYQFSKKVLATGAIPLVLRPYMTSSLLQHGATEESLTEITYRVANGCGIGVVPAGEALAAAGLSAGQVTVDEFDYLIASCIFSRITFLNAKSSNYIPPGGVDKSVLGDSVLAIINNHLNTDQYTGAYNRKGNIQLRMLPESDLPDNEVGYIYSGTSTEDGFSAQLQSLISNHSSPAHTPLVSKIATTQYIDQSVFDAAKPTLGDPNNYDNFHILYARDFEIAATDILAYLGTGSAPAQPHLSCFAYDKQEAYTSLPPMDALAKNIKSRAYYLMSWFDSYPGWQGIAFHLAGARMYEENPAVHPYKDEQHLSDPYSMLAATLMHTCATGFKPNYSGSDASMESAVEIADEAARQLAYLSENGTDVPDSNLRITAAAIPVMIPGYGYSATLTATGGIPPYTWTISEGDSLPAGIVLASNGVLSGILSSSAATADKTFVFRVQDATGAIWKMPCKVRISNKGAFGNWMAVNSSLSGEAAAAAADPDNDGLPNLLEYALNLDPSTASTAIEFTSKTAGTVTVRHQKNTKATEMTVFLQGNSNLIADNWIAIATTSATNLLPDTEWCEADIDVSTTPQYFLRIKVAQ